ncbi:hypothetical protein [Pseudogulbenkiania ferrooxidans]|uniref:Transmembrane protein n=1 Tax=Pseudogulbenkiania ferrooxidans 2002 TaxID=279714 RepID=B9YZR8_9NEIS|nr:hypothetical protein [Pseudogulbenkiania ferrooxidans]EEG09801.1 hypothetical protein FuraDRAFT_0817 [Pseudogulbenkiania ferrooxidans 2002]
MAYLKGFLTLPIVIFIVMFMVIGFFPRFEDPDFYWHLKTGELIASSSQLPWHDVFTYTNSGHSWVNSEWLSQWLLYQLFRLGGLKAVWLFTTSVYVSCWVVSYKTCLDVLKDEGKAALAILLFCVFMGLLAPRPHIFTFLLFALLLRVLFRFKYCASDRGLGWIPLIMLLWANLHGGFFLGLVLMAAFTAAEWAKYCWRDAAGCIAVSRLTRLSLVVLLGLLATAINPQGFSYWLYPYNAIVASGDMQFITEWQSPSFHQWLFQYFLAMVFIFFLTMVYSRRKPDLTEAGVSLIYIAGAFISVRNLPLAAIAMAPHFALFYRDLPVSESLHKLRFPIQRASTAPHPLAARAGKAWAAGNRQVGGAEGVMNLLLLIFALLAIALIYPSRKNLAEESLTELMPVKAVDFILANHIEGRMFNTYHYGGYLIYRLYPQQRVFIYGRTDIYPKGFVDRYLATYRGDKDWKKHFASYGIDYVVCDSSAPIRQLILADGSFKSVFDDGKHSVLLRNVSKYQTLIARYGQNSGRG